MHRHLFRLNNHSALTALTLLLSLNSLTTAVALAVDGKTSESMSISGQADTKLSPSPVEAVKPVDEAVPAADNPSTSAVSVPVPNVDALPAAMEQSTKDLQKDTATAVAVAKGPMPAASPEIAAVIQSRYEAYLKANATAKGFEDIAPYESKQLRDRAVALKASIGQSEKLRGKSDEEKQKAFDALFQFLNMMKPRTATVTGVKCRDNVALVEVTSGDIGQLAEAMVGGVTGMMNKTISGLAGKDMKMPAMKKPKLIGKIYMVNEDGQWNFDGESFESLVSPEEKKAAAAKKAAGAWCAAATTMPFPQKSVSGSIHGQPFAMRNAEYDHHILSLRTGTGFTADSELMIFIFGLDNKNPDGQTLIMRDGEKVGDLDAHIHMHYHLPGQTKHYETETFMSLSQPGVKLQFGQRKGNMLPGYINIRLPDKLHSYAQGYFYALMK